MFLLETYMFLKKFFYNQIFFSLIPFPVSNHLLHCYRYQYESSMCFYCTQLYLTNKKICKMIDRKLTIDVLNYCQVQLSHGVISDGSENLFVHSFICAR